MTAGTATLICSICSEPSTDICVYCTKDACANHRCDRCKRCSDCCECDVPLSAKEVHPEPPIESAVEAPVEILAEAASVVAPEVASEAASDDELSIFAPEPDERQLPEEGHSGDGVFR
jgi:hypothetical protein